MNNKIIDFYIFSAKFNSVQNPVTAIPPSSKSPPVYNYGHHFFKEAFVFIDSKCGV
jgi:hypothetical protein